MQAPSAAGFLPNKSVIDELISIFNTFSPEAKTQRESQRKLTDAQAADIEAQTAWRPDLRAAEWSQQDIAREGLKHSQDKLNRDENLGWANIANDTERNKIGRDSLDQKKNFDDENLFKTLAAAQQTGNTDAASEIFVQILEKFAPGAAAA